MNMFETQPWMRWASCTGIEPSEIDRIFFPKQGGSYREARLLCATCPATKACLNYALDNEITHGMFGGKSEKERKALRRVRRLTAA